ncbi:hypothetical protein BDZ91DRAFT_852901 [Kalaharituber pfeilii]|nr:hypothetical protein BDZ91DRAFT_852901 [Kalaharituber pfeilii]
MVEIPFKKPKNRAEVAFEEFLAKIPEDKLQRPFSDRIRTIYQDVNYRLDMQSMTADSWNLQIQANIMAKEKTVATLSPNTASEVRVPYETESDGDWGPDQIRTKFRENSIFNKNRDIDIEALSRRSSKKSERSFRSWSDKKLTRARTAGRNLKQAFLDILPDSPATTTGRSYGP